MRAPICRRRWPDPHKAFAAFAIAMILAIRQADVVADERLNVQSSSAAAIAPARPGAADSDRCEQTRVGDASPDYPGSSLPWDTFRTRVDSGTRQREAFVLDASGQPRESRLISGKGQVESSPHCVVLTHDTTSSR